MALPTRPVCLTRFGSQELAVDHMAYGNPRCLLTAILHYDLVDQEHHVFTETEQTVARTPA
eukprot:6573027-Pyramimonas_sp.AAC.1